MASSEKRRRFGIKTSKGAIVLEGWRMSPISAQLRLPGLLSAAVLVLCLVVAPANAKNKTSTNPNQNGSLFQPPSAIAKPGVVLDTSTPPVPKTASAGKSGTSVAISAPAIQPQALVTPAKAIEPTKSIENMRLHSLFE
jgi:hypothetical protein